MGVDAGTGVTRRCEMRYVIKSVPVVPRLAVERQHREGEGLGTLVAHARAGQKSATRGRGETKRGPHQPAASIVL